MGEKNTGSSTRSRVILIVANVVSLFCLVWTLKDVKLGALRHDIATMNWWWVGLAVVADLGVYCWDAWRWRLLLHPVEPVTFWQTLRAIYVGLFANEVLPFHVGELLRVYLISRWTALPFSVSLSSALIERVFDGIWLCLCLVLALHFVPHHGHMRYLRDTGYGMAAVVFIGAALLALAMFRRQQTHAALSGDGKVWKRHLRVLIDDLSLIGHSRYLYFAFLQSLPYLLLQVIPIYASFKGFRHHGFNELTLRDAFALMVILRVGSIVPQAPGNLGLFQFLTRNSLVRMYGIFPADAERFSLVLWGIVTLPLLIAGAVALAVTGARIGELQRAARHESDQLAESRQ